MDTLSASISCSTPLRSSARATPRASVEKRQIVNGQEVVEARKECRAIIGFVRMPTAKQADRLDGGVCRGLSFETVRQWPVMARHLPVVGLGAVAVTQMTR